MSQLIPFSPVGIHKHHQNSSISKSCDISSPEESDHVVSQRSYENKHSPIYSKPYSKHALNGLHDFSKCNESVFISPGPTLKRKLPSFSQDNENVEVDIRFVCTPSGSKSSRTCNNEKDPSSAVFISPPPPLVRKYIPFFSPFTVQECSLDPSFSLESKDVTMYPRRKKLIRNPFLISSPIRKSPNLFRRLSHAEECSDDNNNFDVPHPPLGQNAINSSLLLSDDSDENLSRFRKSNTENQLYSQAVSPLLPKKKRRELTTSNDHSHLDEKTEPLTSTQEQVPLTPECLLHKNKVKDRSRSTEKKWWQSKTAPSSVLNHMLMDLNERSGKSENKHELAYI